MLEFVRELFVRMPPNTTSWCDTLEIFLGKRSYKLTTRVGFIKFNEVQFLNSLTRTLYDVDFGNALRWYYSLVNATEVYVKKELETARASLASADVRNDALLSEGAVILSIAVHLIN